MSATGGAVRGAGRTLALLGLLAAVSAALAASGSGFPRLNGPWLGQSPPGLTPELFAPGIVCSGLNERDVAVSADGREIYFGVSFGRVTTIMWTRLQGGRWSEPEVAPFAADAAYFHFEPALSADGRRVFFLTNRPGPGGEAKPGWANQTIWAADRAADGSWGEPYDPAPEINGGGLQFFPSLTRDGTLYFSRMDRKTRRTEICRARRSGAGFGPVEALPAPVNGEGTPYNAFIAPDESYLIACVDGKPLAANPGTANYFVFFRDAHDRWSEGVALGGEVNWPGSTAMSPYVSPDGRYFFFAAQRTAARFQAPLRGRTLAQLVQMSASAQNGNYDIYWVDARVIAALRPASGGKPGAPGARRSR
jgi:hypothetical protein